MKRGHTHGRAAVAALELKRATDAPKILAWTLAYEEWPLASDDERKRWAESHWQEYLSKATALLPLIESASRQAVEAALREAAKIADGWLQTYATVVVKHIRPEKFAADAVTDVRDAILSIDPATITPSAGAGLVSEATVEAGARALCIFSNESDRERCIGGLCGACRDEARACLQAAFASAGLGPRGAGEWREIATAPDDGRLVWVWPPRPGRDPAELVQADGEHWRWCKAEGMKHTPRFWMPAILPPPPADGQEEAQP